ncbi:HalX domain-containing protein [Haloplanus sp.]|uniref:HalX domain-containing protein n=1 Tax=Haloplanus sp. TaxID=1961696 RepID=UPI0026171BF7|nr:HalX domain-containing protein [Haloplanus sp.]
MTTTLSDPTVLIVDDEESLADLYAYWVDSVAEARVAYNGDDALTRLDGTVDVLLLDRRMPGMSGDEVVEAVSDRDHDVRVVMVTAIDPGFDIVEMEIDDYLVKPVARPQLVDTVERMLVRTSYNDQLQRKFQLVEKKVTLEAAKSPHELDESDEYTRLVTELDALERELDSAVESFDDTDFTVAFRELPGGGTVDSTER